MAEETRKKTIWIRFDDYGNHNCIKETMHTKSVMLSESSMTILLESCLDTWHDHVDFLKMDTLDKNGPTQEYSDRPEIEIPIHREYEHLHGYGINIHIVDFIKGVHFYLKDHGLNLDHWDLQFYSSLQKKIKKFNDQLENYIGK
jgi:hypothetical protein